MSDDTDLIPNGWTVVEDVEPTPNFDISELKPCSGYISGEEMRRRATVLRFLDGRYGVPCLYWDGGFLFLDFYWLDYDWDDSYRFACIK